MSTKKLLAVGLLAACVTVQMNAQNAFTNDLKQTLAKRDDSKQIETPVSSDGPSFVIHGANDTKLTIGGDHKTEYRRAHNSTLLNSKLPDEYAFWANRTDIKTGFSYGEKKYNKPVFEMGSTLRVKYVAGDMGKYLRTSGGSIKIADASVNLPGSSINLPLGWFKHLWGSANLSRLLGRSGDHSVKVGMFDYQLGRGISYGPFYGLNKSFLGVFNAASDFAPFSILVSGDIVKGKLSYDLYWARLEEMSGNFKQTFNHAKAHLVGRKVNPASGVGKANDVFAGKLKFNYSSPKLGTWSSETYAMLNEASDQKVDLPKDSKSQLFTSGWMFDYSNGNWELGGEVAINRGSQQMYAIDNNAVTLVSSGGSLEQRYNKVDLNGAETTKVTTNTKPLVDAYNGSSNGAQIGTYATTNTLTNAADRFRPAYKNNYRGWMAVLDASYKIPSRNMKLSAAVGHASGDTNPHTKKEDKNYNGFVGMHECYAGQRVKSALVLGDRKAVRPISTNSINETVINDTSFTDMTYVGGALEWAPKNVKASVNVLGYWKDKEAHKVANQYDFADKYMGTEASIIVEWTLMKNLKMSGIFALFKPGQYYTDIKGTQLDATLSKAIDTMDRTGYDQAVPSSGDDTEFYINFGCQYKF